MSLYIVQGLTSANVVLTSGLGTPPVVSRHILAVTTDFSDYSRYGIDASEKNITCRFITQNAIAGDVFTVTLNRLDGYGAVATKSYTWLGSELNSVATVVFSLENDCLDDRFIYRAIQGDYACVAIYAADTLTKLQSATFTISIVGIREMRRTWLYGMNLLASEIKAPKFQPRLITGVSVLEVSQDHDNGVYTLQYTVAAGAANPAIPQAGIYPGLQTAYTLSWAGGTPIPIAPGILSEYMLLDAAVGDWIRVQVDPLFLPNQSVGESIIIEQSRIQDADIIREVRLATSWLEGQFQNSLPVEPRTLSTDPNALPADAAADTPFIEGRVDTGAFDRPMAFGMAWMNVQFSKRGVLAIYNLDGYMNQTQVIQVPVSQWVVLSEKNGRCDLVPSSGSQVAWILYGQPFFAFLFNYTFVPGFWHYTGTFGLRDLTRERSQIREAIAKKASIEIMLIAGSAYRAGYASESTSRDGVSSSVSYTSSAMYSIYSHVTVPYGEWLDKNIVPMRQKFLGLQFLMLQ